jgi:UPF0755 protein
MTIRGGGGPRDDRSHAHPAPRGTYDEDWTPEPRKADRRRYDFAERRGGGLPGFVRFVLFAVILASIVLIGLFTVLRPLVTNTIVGWAYDNPSALRLPFVAGLVRENLGAALSDPPSSDATPVEFEVVAGDTPATLARRLRDAGLISDPRAFIFEATLDGLTPKLQAGNFRLAKNMTPAQLVEGLVNNRIVITVVRVGVRESLRIEQIAALLDKMKTDDHQPLNALDPKQFYDLATHPTAELLADYPWLTESGRPDKASLEGFLAPATYDLTPDSTAEDFIRQMLQQFERSVGAERMQVPKSRGLTFFQVLTLASIVEREAKLDEERPLIAGVYQNRLDKVNKAVPVLNADPTVFYGLDTLELQKLPFDEWKTFSFWQAHGNLNAVQLPKELAGYQTYQQTGLPPGPICTPSVASIDAALQPDTKDKYLFFLAIPNGNGAHAFARTQAEHDANRKKYGYG